MSVFNCNKTYRKVEGDSFTSTHNRLRSQGFVDKYWNVTTDVATWRKARAELNQLAQDRLGLENLNLFGEKKLLNGIRAVPDMKLFGMLDQKIKKASQEEINNKQTEDVSFEEILGVDSENTIEDFFSSLDVTNGSVIPIDKRAQAESLVESYNRNKNGLKFSLVEALGGVMLQTEYQNNYLFLNPPQELDIPEQKFPETNSNNDFNKPCL